MIYRLFLPFVARSAEKPAEPEPPLEIVDIRHTLVWHATKIYSTRPYSWIKGIAVHHVGARITDSNPTGSSTPYNVSAFHVYQRDWPGPGYDIWIERDGQAFQRAEHSPDFRLFVGIGR